MDPDTKYSDAFRGILTASDSKSSVCRRGRAVKTAALAQLEREAGFVVIKDGLGGYTHNAAIHVVLGTC